jgi:tape measure domain-containing protein
MATGLTLKIAFDGSSVERGISKIATSFTSFATTGVATISAGLAAAVASMTAFGIASAKSASEMEDLETQFGVLLKSTSAAKDMMAEFRKEAIKSPLSIEDYAKAGKTLLAFGVTQNKVLPSLKMLGDVSMGNADRFSSLALAFAQTQAAGRLMGQEVLQFVNAGFNPLQVISDKTGLSMATLKKRMEDGAISAEMVSDAFKVATSEGGLFFGALEKGSQTTSGKFAKLVDAFDQLKVSFGTGLNIGLSAAYEKLGGVIPQFMETFRKAGLAIGTAIADAIKGDTARIEAIGFYLGTILKDGIMAALKATAEDIGTELMKGVEKYTMFGGALQAAGVSKNMEAGERGFSNYFQENKANRQQMLSGIEMSNPETREINGQLFRSATSAEAAASRGGIVDENGKKLILVMGKVEKNTRNVVSW